MITKNDYRILFILKESQITNELKAITLNELKDISGLSISKIRNTIDKFKKLKYISIGANEYSAKTYYITDDGIDLLNKLLK